jgi:hypothetical protein
MIASETKMSDRDNYNTTNNKERSLIFVGKAQQEPFLILRCVVSDQSICGDDKRCVKCLHCVEHDARYLLFFLLGKNLVRVLGEIRFGICIIHMDIDNDVSATCLEAVDEEVPVLFVS